VVPEAILLMTGFRVALPTKIIYYPYQVQEYSTPKGPL
jgi:hypothetical protein